MVRPQRTEDEMTTLPGAGAGAPSMAAAEYDLLSPETTRDPRPLLHRMRREDPVHWSPRLRGYVLTRYDDIARALSDPRLTAARLVSQLDRLPEEQRRQLLPLRDSIAMWMGHTNPTDHLRL